MSGVNPDKVLLFHERKITSKKRNDFMFNYFSIMSNFVKTNCVLVLWKDQGLINHKSAIFTPGKKSYEGRKLVSCCRSIPNSWFIFNQYFSVFPMINFIDRMN